MSFPAYENYTPSGIEWLPEVPSHWNAGRLRWLATIYSGGTPDKKNENYWTDGTVPWLNSGAVNQQLVTEPSTYITQDALENSSAKWVPEDALVIALAGQGKTKGMVAQLAFRTTCNQSMAAIIPTSDLDARFLFWWLTSNYQNIRNLSGGDLRDGLNLQLLGTIGCPIPDVDEQKAISSFLDVETSKIDGLVSEQRRLIELLKEKRQAVISHAVTKGLNPNAPMKPSGIDWVGEIPEHWRMPPVFARYYAVLGKMLDEAKLTGEHPIRYLRNADVNWDSINTEDLPIFDIEPDEYERFAVMPGDILICEGGAGIGQTAIWQGELERCAFQKALHRLRPWNAECENPRFFYYCMRYVVETGVVLAGGTATIPHLTGEQLRKYRFPRPPKEEQDDIVEFLNAKISRFDALEAEAERAIELLQERRTALISAAVTGKIDVREFAYQETA